MSTTTFTFRSLNLSEDTVCALYAECLDNLRADFPEIPDLNNFSPKVYKLVSVADLNAHILHYNICTVQQYRTLRLFNVQNNSDSASLYALFVFALSADSDNHLKALCMLCWFCCCYGIALRVRKPVREYQKRFYSEEHTLLEWIDIVPEYVELGTRADDDYVYTEENSKGYPLDFLNFYKDERDLTKILDGVFSVLPPGPRALFDRAYGKY